MGEVRDLIGAQRAAAAGVLGPAEHPGLEEGAIDDQLPAALEQVEQAGLAVGPFELIRLLDGHPRHPPPFGGQGVAGPRQGFFLHEHLLARSLPRVRRHDRRDVHGGLFAVRGILNWLRRGHGTLRDVSQCEQACQRPSIGVSYKCGAILRRLTGPMATRFSLVWRA